MNPLLWVAGSVSLSFDISGCNFRNIYVFYNAHQENKIKPKYLLPVAVMSSLLSTWYSGFYLSEPWSSWSLPFSEVYHAPVTSAQRPLCHWGSAPTVTPWRWRVWNACSSCIATTHICESGHRWNQARHSLSLEGPCGGVPAVPCARSRGGHPAQRELKFAPECLPSGRNETWFQPAGMHGRNVVNKVKKTNGTDQIQEI